MTALVPILGISAIHQLLEVVNKEVTQRHPKHHTFGSLLLTSYKTSRSFHKRVFLELSPRLHQACVDQISDLLDIVYCMCSLQPYI